MLLLHKKICWQCWHGICVVPLIMQLTLAATFTINYDPVPPKSLNMLTEAFTRWHEKLRKRVWFHCSSTALELQIGPSFLRELSVREHLTSHFPSKITTHQWKQHTKKNTAKKQFTCEISKSYFRAKNVYLRTFYQQKQLFLEMGYLRYVKHHLQTSGLNRFAAQKCTVAMNLSHAFAWTCTDLWIPGQPLKIKPNPKLFKPRRKDL